MEDGPSRCLRFPFKRQWSGFAKWKTRSATFRTTAGCILVEEYRDNPRIPTIMNYLRLCVVVCLFCFSEISPAQETRPAPHVILLVVDDLGWNGVGFHDPRAPTPNLDRLARESVELRRFYTCPVCSPTRTALLTGRMPRRMGIVDVVGPQQAGLPAGVATLPAAFRAAGYGIWGR